MTSSMQIAQKILENSLLHLDRAQAAEALISAV